MNRVYVAEYGHGARAGRMIRTYQTDDGTSRVVVKLDDQDCPRDCFASSVFTDPADAERASED